MEPHGESGSSRTELRASVGIVVRSLIVCGSLFSAFGLSVNLAHSTPADLQIELDRFSSATESGSISVSALFVPLEGSLLHTVQYEADRVVVPASVTKLVTSLAALRELGPDYTFVTRISRQGSLGSNGVLSGNLIIEGTGDPFFVSEKMWLLASQLRQSGIRQIDGDLVFQGSTPAGSNATKGQASEESDRAYAALPSSLAMNFNSTAVRIIPGAKPGDPIRVVGEPVDCSYLALYNQLKTGPAGTAPKWFFEMEITPAGQSLLAEGGGEQSRWISDGAPLELAQLRGRIPAGTRPFVAFRRIRFPVAHYGAMFRTILEQIGIEVRGQVVLDSNPGERTLVIEFESPPLQDLLASMNRYSNNFMANQLALAIHGQDSDDELSSGTLAEAGAHLAQWMIETIGASRDIVLEDGSGLSPNNRLNADALVKVLTEAWNNFSIRPKLIFGLPGPRGIGTLKSRFGGSAPPPDLWAKTGTFRDARVCSLAGYFESPEGPVAFAILMNGDPGSRWNVSRMQTLQEFWIDLYLR